MFENKEQMGIMGERTMNVEEIAYKVNLAKAECRYKGLDMLGYKVCLYFTKQTILDLLIIRNQVNPELTFNECKKGGVFMGCSFKVADEDKVVIEKEIV